MEQTPKQLRNEKLGAKVVKAMESRHFEAYYCGTKEEALKKALDLIPEGSVVAWGGSVTMNEIGLSEALHSGNYQLIDRDAAPPEERRKLMRQGLLADYFISGANAVSEDGEIVNIDGSGKDSGGCRKTRPDHSRAHQQAAVWRHHTLRQNRKLRRLQGGGLHLLSDAGDKSLPSGRADQSDSGGRRTGILIAVLLTDKTPLAIRMYGKNEKSICHRSSGT